MLQICLLGTPTIERDGQPLPPFKSRKVLGLLAYLALQRGKHSRSHLAGLLWSDCSEDQALANLRYTLWNLNQVLGVSIVQADRTTVELRAEPLCVFDTDEFLDALRQAENNRQGESPTTVAALERAVALYRGDLLAGLEFEGLIGEWLNANVHVCASTSLMHCIGYRSFISRNIAYLKQLPPCAACSHSIRGARKRIAC